MSDNFSNGQFCWYEIATRDAAAAKTFYTGLFGYTPDDQPMPGGTYTSLKLQGKDVAGLYQMGGPDFEGVSPHWMTFVWVDDVDATTAKAKSLGGSAKMEPGDIPGVGRMAVLADPSGAVFALFHGTDHPGTAQLGSTQGTIGWNELTTPDAAASASFYTQLFDWTAREQNMGDTVYTTFKQGENMVGGMMQMDPAWAAGMHPHWGQYVTVDDCDATVAKATKLGAETVVEPQDIPTIGRFAVLKDPTGAHFSVATWAEPAS